MIKLPLISSSSSNKSRVLSITLLCLFFLIFIIFIRLHSLLNDFDGLQLQQSNKKNDLHNDSVHNPGATLRANVNTYIQPKTVVLDEDVLSLLHKRRDHDIYPDFQMFLDGAPDCKIHIKRSDIDFTLVTQLSDDRLWMLKEHCSRWKGAMSVVIFTDIVLDEITSSLLEYGCPIDKNNLTSKKFSLQVVSKKGHSDDDYPVNRLRNLALSEVKTSHMLYVDVDFWPGEETYNSLVSENVKAWLASDPLLAIVIPAFQINRQCREYRDCREPNLKKMPKTFDDVFKLWNNKHRQIFMFDPTNRGGHGSTLYDKFFEMKLGSLVDLDCVKSNRYEPYIAVRYCDELPPYQELFTGYGKNKVTHAMQMRRSGYFYSQVGGGFFVHYPHLDSESRVKWNLVEDKIHRETSTRAQVDKLFVKFKAWIIDVLPDMTRAYNCEDFQNDDHKLWLD